MPPDDQYYKHRHRVYFLSVTLSNRANAGGVFDYPAIGGMLFVAYQREKGKCEASKEIAGAVASLASDDSSFATGSIVTVNGGAYFS